MSFNFEAAKAAAQKDLDVVALNLILLGAQGNGKSDAIGSFGVPTLHLYNMKEDHGPASSKNSAIRRGFDANNVMAIRFDVDENGKKITPDEQLKYLVRILSDLDLFRDHGIQAVALDSATEIESVIKSTSEYAAMLSAKYKGVEAYAGPLVLSAFRPVIAALKELRRELGVHSLMTCPLDVLEYGANGEIAHAKPSLAGYNVATGLCQMFADVIVIGKMQRPDGSIGYPFQMGAHVSKATKDFDTKEIRKTHNFNIRLTGCDMSSFPDYMPSDLSVLIKCKKARKYVE